MRRDRSDNLTCNAPLQAACEAALASLPDAEEGGGGGGRGGGGGADEAFRTLTLDSLLRTAAPAQPPSSLLAQCRPLSLAALPALAAAVADAARERVWLFGDSPSLNVPLPEGVAEGIEAALRERFAAAEAAGGAAALLPLLGWLQAACVALQVLR